MKRNLLAAVTSYTSPLTDREMEEVLLQEHGAVSRENASADASALDSVGTEALVAKEAARRQAGPEDGRAVVTMAATTNAARRSKARRKAGKAAKPALVKKEPA